MFNHYPDVFSDLPADTPAIVLVNECPTSEQDDVDCVPAASSPFLMKGPTGIVSRAPHVSSHLIEQITIDMSFLRAVNPLLLTASLPDLLSVLTSNVSLTAPLTISPQASSWAGSTLPTLFALALMSPTSAETALASCRFLQYINKRLAQRESKLAILREKCIQRGEFVTSIKAR